MPKSPTAASPASREAPDASALAVRIKRWAQELGFSEAGITDTDLSEAESFLFKWLEQGRHGAMQYMQAHGTKRSRPVELLPNTVRVVSVRLNYWPDATNAEDVLNNGRQAFISRYALGRDYHKVLRLRLQKLADRIEAAVGPYSYRVFTDSAPVLEKPLAEKAGLGWIGKHTNVINQDEGSWFFLGEIYTDLPLPVDAPAINHCGTCHACLDACPTQAIVAPYQLDARRCISYLTIEWRGSIPEEFRAALGNRIYGCDDCQLACPWNRFARISSEKDFAPRHGLDSATLVELFSWTEDEFLKHTEGSAIRRIGYECWQRNLAVALGNAPASRPVTAALNEKTNTPSPLVNEHVAWALAQQKTKP
jgi:epoxyqueuosine reductase